MTLTLSDPKKEKPARVPKPAADVDTLRRLAARIEEMKDTRLDELTDELFADEKMRMKTVGDVMIITLCGVRGESTAGRYMALTNWAMAARRKIIEMEG